MHGFGQNKHFRRKNHSCAAAEGRSHSAPGVARPGQEQSAATRSFLHNSWNWHTRNARSSPGSQQLYREYLKQLRTKAWGMGRRSLRRDRTRFGFMAQPGLTVQLSPNSTELLNSECATSQTAETLFFLSSQSPKATQGVPRQQQAGNQRSSAPSALHSWTATPTTQPG